MPAAPHGMAQGRRRASPPTTAPASATATARVWNTRGLWVASNKVIPTVTACNPTLTSVALAVRGARAVLDHLHDLSRRGPRSVS